MTVAAPYQIAIESSEIVVRFDRSVFQADELTELLDYLRLKSLRRQSQLTDEKIETLADDVNQSAWQRIKDDFLAGIE